MAKYAEAPYQPKHTGKSGYISSSPRGSPKPFPFGVVEEFGANLYPYYRGYIPEDYQKYADSYIDLRNKPYKVWYDKWGKPHINKWWRKQLDETFRIQKAYQAQNGKFGYSRTRNYGRNFSRQHKCSCDSRIPKYLRCRKCFIKHRSTRQRSYRKRWTPYGYNDVRSKYQKYRRKWNR